MTDIICSWLNNDLKLSKFIDENNFSNAFSNGYLIGEILNKYDLVNEFGKLSKKSTAETKLNNFILLEPILKLLGVTFNKMIAKDLIDGKPSVLINLLYQLFIALENKKRSNLTGLSMQTMQAPATTRLQELESTLYQHQLKKANPRQSDLELQEIINRYQDYQQKIYDKSQHDKLLSADNRRQRTEQHRQDRLDRSKAMRNDQNELMSRLEAAVVKIPKPPASKTLEAIMRKKALSHQKEAENALRQLDEFEKRQMNIVGKEALDETFIISREESFSVSDGGLNEEKASSFNTAKSNGKTLIESVQFGEHIRLENNNEYIVKIRARLESDKDARVAREKRRRKVLVNCLKSHYEQEENDRESMVALRLMRQSQMERRIAVQLLQLRHEKDIIKINRMERETQYQERREVEFLNALEKERELLKQLKETNKDNLKAEQDLYNAKKADTKMKKYKKHYTMAEKIIDDMIEFSCKTSEYNELTDCKIPSKIIQDWKLAFIHGVPICDRIVDGIDIVNEDNKEVRSIDIQDVSVPISRVSSQYKNIDEYQRKIEILDEQDLVDYKQFTGDWEVNDDLIKTTDCHNNILNWVVDHLYSLNNPIDNNAQISILPPFPIKIAVVGKCFSGKSTLIQNLVKNNRCISVVPQEVIAEALRAFDDNEENEIKVSLSTVVAPELSKDDEMGAVVVHNKTDDEKTENQVSDANLNTMVNDTTASFNADDDTERMMFTVATENAEEILSVRKEPSPRAIIGKNIKEELLSGRSINDQLLVDAIIEYLGRIPEGTGWIIDDFPATYQQGKLFEKAVSGYDERAAKVSEKKRQKATGQAKECGIDTIILLDTPDSACLARAMTISERLLEGETHATGITKDVIANLQTSMTNFAEHWPKLAKFYTRINEKIIKTVNSSDGVTPTEIYLQVEMILDDIILAKQPPEEPAVIALPTVDVTVVDDQVTLDIPVSQSDNEAASKEVLTTVKSSRKRSKGSKSSKASSRASSAGSKSSEKKSTSRKSRSKSKTDSAKSKKEKIPTKAETAVKHGKAETGKRKGSKGSKGSKSSGRSSSSKGKKGKVLPEEKTEEIVVPEVHEPQPGDSDWVYTEKPLDKELTTTLYGFWEALSNMYTTNCKQSFREVRYGRDEIIRYLHAVKKAFRQFLIRPDAKQDYIDQFQKDFNELTEEWRDDEEVQQEFHIRITELKDQLLEISQENQATAEKEIEKIRSYGWIEDRVGTVSNQYINLMQSEFDRFQDIVRLLRDYYRSTMNPTMDEFKPEFLRLPMIEIPIEKENNTDRKDSSQTLDSNKQAAANPTTSPAVKKSAGKAGGKVQAPEITSGEDSKEMTDEDIEIMFKTRVPLIEFKCLGPQITSAMLTSVPSPTKVIKGKDMGAAIVKLIQSGKFDKKGEKMPEWISPPIDGDERLLFDVVSSCYSIINGMLELELSQYGEKEEPAKPGAAGDKGKADKKGKGGKKSRTPTPKKGGKDKTNSVTEAEETEEEKQNKIFMEKAKNEYIAALQKEATITRTKLIQIMYKGNVVLRDLKSNVDIVFNELSAWIANKLLTEDTSIKDIENIFRYHVETKCPLVEKIELVDDRFYLNPIYDDTDNLRPMSRPGPIEPMYENSFSIKQLNAFYCLFQVAADTKNGSISIFDFVKLITEALMATDAKLLPPFISKCTHIDASLSAVADSFSCDKEYVNWRLFMLSCSEPWDWPSQADLLDLLNQFKELDQQSTGFVTREQYQFVNLWFSIPSTPPTPSDILEPKIVNRMSEIKKLFFDIFKHQNEPTLSHDTTIQQHIVEYLDYEDMLLHFAVFCTNKFYSGLLRALSVVVGQHVPHISIIMKDIELLSDQDRENVPPITDDVNVTIQQLYRVLSLGHRKSENFSADINDVDLEDVESERDTILIKSLKNIYESMEQETENMVKFTNLLKHEGLLEWFSSCQWFRYVDVKTFFADPTESFRAPLE